MKKKKIRRVRRIAARRDDVRPAAPVSAQPPQDTFRERLQRYYEMMDLEDNWLVGWMRYRIDPERWDPRPELLPEDGLDIFDDDDDEKDEWPHDGGEEEW